MKEYKCEFAIRQEEYIICRKKNDICGNSRFCRMGNRYKLTEMAEKCPVKNAAPEKTAVKKVKKNGQK